MWGVCPLRLRRKVRLARTRRSIGTEFHWPKPLAVTADSRHRGAAREPVAAGVAGLSQWAAGKVVEPEGQLAAGEIQVALGSRDRTARSRSNGKAGTGEDSLVEV